MFLNRHAGQAALAFASSILACTVALAGTAASTLVGRTAASRTVGLAFHLPSRDPHGAHDFAVRATTPGDPLYRRFLTPAAYAARFGANPADIAAVSA